AWLVDAAAIVAQQALRDSSYGPYSRTMKKICWEESVHIMHGRDVVVTMMNGTANQRAMVQEALDRWWGPLMQMHGPRTDPAKDRSRRSGSRSGASTTSRPRGCATPSLMRPPPTASPRRTAKQSMSADEQLPSEGRRDDAGRLGAGAEPDVWEVFRQEKEGD